MQAKRPKVTVRNLMKEFSITRDGRPVTVRALNEVSFDVYDGELVAFIGHSGCGKTTTLRLIMGLEQATAGSIEVDGRRVTRERVPEVAVGFVARRHEHVGQAIMPPRV